MDVTDCGCNDGYYDDGLNNDCVQCPNPHKVSQCTSDSNITVCKPGFERSMNTVDCGCNEGFYEDGTNLNCKECEYPCTKCSDTSTCVGECSSTLNRNSAPTCS